MNSITLNYENYQSSLNNYSFINSIIQLCEINKVTITPQNYYELLDYIYTINNFNSNISKTALLFRSGEHKGNGFRFLRGINASYQISAPNHILMESLFQAKEYNMELNIIIKLHDDKIINILF